MLLCLLSNTTDLPVSKAVVKDSGMGKAIGSIEKSDTFRGNPNETTIKERVQALKNAWQKSVKAMKVRIEGRGAALAWQF